jgi:hypothetical protein
MIKINHHLHQVRVDTTIKIIEKDGTEITAPVVILIGLNKVESKHHYNIYKIATVLFNKNFTLNRQKPLPKKPWWKMW